MNQYLNCSFTSVWDNGSEITTRAKYDTSDGEVIAKSSKADPDGNLEREFITLPDEEEIEVCTSCHSYVMKVVMNPDSVGKGLHEDTVCSDPDCESNQ